MKNDDSPNEETTLTKQTEAARLLEEENSVKIPVTPNFTIGLDEEEENDEKTTTDYSFSENSKKGFAKG